MLRSPPYTYIRMAPPQRVLYVSSEVAPFIEGSETAALVRLLSEQLKAGGGCDVRMMMPRYGLINQRKNRLHEVIRLSKAGVSVNGTEYPVSVKVASIPDTRQQVYFADNPDFFKRKAVYRDQEGNLFEDNTERALFFSKAVLSTLELLHWAPDVLHTVGAMGAFVPLLLKEKRPSSDLLSSTRSLFTPERDAPETAITRDKFEALGLTIPGSIGDGTTLTQVGLHFADAVIMPSTLTGVDGYAQFSEKEESLSDEAVAVYEQLSAEVAA